MGGGEGKTSGGRPSVSPWGKSAKGGKTRNPRKSMQLIARRRDGRTVHQGPKKATYGAKHNAPVSKVKVGKKARMAAKAQAAKHKK